MGLDLLQTDGVDICTGKEEFALEDQSPSWEACTCCTVGLQGDITEAITRDSNLAIVLDELTGHSRQTRKPSGEVS